MHCIFRIYVTIVDSSEKNQPLVNVYRSVALNAYTDNLPKNVIKSNLMTFDIPTYKKTHNISIQDLRKK